MLIRGLEAGEVEVALLGVAVAYLDRQVGQVFQGVGEPRVLARRFP